MNHYEDITNAIKKANPEMQLYLNEVALGRNLAELNAQGLRANAQIVTVPVNFDGNIFFRAAVFEKGTVDERDVLVEVAQGKTYSDKCLIISGDSQLLEAFKPKAKKADEEE